MATESKFNAGRFTLESNGGNAVWLWVGEERVLIYSDELEDLKYVLGRAIALHKEQSTNRLADLVQRMSLSK